MNKFLFGGFAFLFACSVLFTACKKNKSEDPAPPSSNSTSGGTCLIATVGVPGSVLSTVSYDGQYRISKTEEAGRYELYTYSANKITRTYYYGGNPTLTEKFYLNSDGTVDHKTLLNNLSPINVYDTVFYTYDSQGYNTLAVKKRVYGDDPDPLTDYDSIWYTFSGGDLISQKVKDPTGDITFYDFTYSNQPDKLQLFADDIYIAGLYGKGNQHLMASSTERGSTVTTTKTYTLNAEGYYTSVTSVEHDTDYPDDDTEDTETFTYTCH